MANIPSSCSAVLGHFIRAGLLPTTCFIFTQEFKPHVFIVAEEAYRNVRGQLHPANQSLVVSGESGAGKVSKERASVNISHGGFPPSKDGLAPFSWSKQDD